MTRLRGQDLTENAKGGGGGVALDYAYLDILLSDESDGTERGCGGQHSSGVS